MDESRVKFHCVLRLLPDAQPVPLPGGPRLDRRCRLWRALCVGEFCHSDVAGNDANHPAGKISKAIAVKVRDMRSKTSDAKLTSLFLDMLAAEQGAGDNTLQAYRRDLEDFSEFLGRNRQGLATVQTERLRDYLSDLDTRGFKSSSVARRLSAIRHLFRFLLSERIRGDDPAAILSGPKRGRGLPKVLSIADVDRMLTLSKQLTQTADASPSHRLRAMRLYCLLEVLYATGLRVSELVSLPRTSARNDARMIVVRGKGAKERLVPLNDASRQAMADFLAATEAHGA